jgi:hypothetical protein
MSGTTKKNSKSHPTLNVYGFDKGTRRHLIHNNGTLRYALPANEVAIQPPPDRVCKLCKRAPATLTSNELMSIHPKTRLNH